ncbi:MAG TPA: hypothetical protein VHT30_09865 [Acidimicrobiales bacterium]|jgi:hypothetical protein|nr:hypothetical protein [Acidimicrobiales bacterium]
MAAPIESDGHSSGNPRLYEVIEGAPKVGTGKSPTIWAWPEICDYLKVAAQPVQGPWPPNQQPRPDPSEESLPIAVPDYTPVRRTGQAASQGNAGPAPSDAPSRPASGGSARRVSLRDQR